MCILHRVSTNEKAKANLELSTIESVHAVKLALCCTFSLYSPVLKAPYVCCGSKYKWTYSINGLTWGNLTAPPLVRHLSLLSHCTLCSVPCFIFLHSVPMWYFSWKAKYSVTFCPIFANSLWELQLLTTCRYSKALPVCSLTPDLQIGCSPLW